MTTQNHGAANASSLADGVIRIWRRHHQTVYRRVAFVAEAVALLQLSQLPSDVRRQAADDAHKLAGNLGTFGHPLGSEHARAVELALQSQAPLSSMEIKRMSAHAEALQAAVKEIAAAMNTAEYSQPESWRPEAVIR